MKEKILIVLAVVGIVGLGYGGYWLYDYFNVGTPLGITLTPGQPNIPDDQPIKILAFGDSGDGSSGQNDLATLMAEEEFDLVLHLGDLVYPRGSYDDFQDNVINVYDQKILDVMWPVMGNHDFASEAGAPYLETFELPTDSVTPADAERYYSVDIGRLHLVGLDTNSSIDQIQDDWDNDMADWLERDLAAADGKVPLVFFHHVAFSAGKHSPHALVREHILPIVDQFNVPLVLTGHDHNYQRTCPLIFSESGEACQEDGGTTYIVSGGGSDNLYKLDDEIPEYFEKAVVASHYMLITLLPDNSFTVEVKDVGGNIIDSFTIAQSQQ